ncbi:hypothetical protein ACFVFS_17200 [Kitasatospora sp. NPDC057692]|uniref:hypothetical protein n=1 Tax=Kitasatospora sp. NPDC057692 TaxID=3346215 RepID=UPI003689329A
MATLSHIEYVTAEELSEDDVNWLGGLFGLGETWTEDFAVVCVIENGSPRSYLSLDIDYARMLEAAHEAGQPVELDATVTTEKLPVNRDGWPGHWMGFVE